MPGRAGRPRHLRPVPAPEGTRYQVRLSVAWIGGWRVWGAVSGGFEQHLAAQQGPAVADAHIDSERRRGRDYYVAVTVSMTVRAADVAQALTAAWDTFRLAAADDAEGWDLASAAAEIWPGEQ